MLDKWPSSPEFHLECVDASLELKAIDEYDIAE